MNPNDPAFPNLEHRTGLGVMGVGEMFVPMGGLTKRELFAAMAMQGILASREIQSSAIYKMDKEWTANESCAHADALIAELSKEVTK